MRALRIPGIPIRSNCITQLFVILVVPSVSWMNNEECNGLTRRARAESCNGNYKMQIICI